MARISDDGLILAGDEYMLTNWIDTSTASYNTIDTSFDELRSRVAELEEALKKIGGHCFFEANSPDLEVNNDDPETSISFENLHGFLDEFSVKQE